MCIRDSTPIVLLDVPGGSFWQGFRRFVDEELVTLGVVSPDDLDRVLITDSVDAAVDEIKGFWRNYDSLRWVGKRLVLRMRAEATEAEVDALNEQFGDLLLEGRIERSGPLSAESSGNDKLELPRLVMVWNQFRIGSLHRLIRALNHLDSAPPVAEAPAPVATA